MKAKDLRDLIAVLRENGVTRYRAKSRGSEVELDLLPARPAAPAPSAGTITTTLPPVPPELAKLGVTSEQVDALFAHVT